MSGKRGKIRHDLWQTMRLAKEAGQTFTVPWLMATAEAGKSSVYSYVWALRRAGYVAQVRVKNTGALGNRAEYRLIRDTGPLAPKLTNHREIVDPNPAKPSVKKGVSNG